MKYGYFDDINREYVITNPNTPSPWINYLGDSNFFSLISNTGGGYSFYKDAKLRRLTRYRYNNVPEDTDGRHIYIKDGTTTFSPTYLPSKEPLDSYECHIGLGYSRFIGVKNGLVSNLLCFVPLQENCEIQYLTIENTTKETKKIDVFAQVEWCLWNASDDNENFQRNLSTGEVEYEDNTIYHKTEYRERRNHYAFYHCSEAIHSFESDRDEFLGIRNGYDHPLQIENGSLGNTLASGAHPIAALHVQLTLKPGEKHSLSFILGYCEITGNEKKFESLNIINKRPAKEMYLRYQNEKSLKDAFIALKKHWDSLLSVYNVTSDNEKLDRMGNIWNQYQCMVTYQMSRSASYYESGIGRGMGFRDSCQDLLGFVHLLPEKAKERILDIASIQKEDGSTFHQYQPLTKRGNGDIGSGFNDDPLWLIAAVSAYIKETGDFDILNIKVPFNNLEGSEKPLLDHLKASINFTINHKGPHGLPLIGRADWNDCLNLNCYSTTPGESFQTTANKETGIAESVFIAGMFVLYGKEYARINELIGNKSEGTRVNKEVLLVKEAAEKYGWDGEYFLRAYDGNGDKVGSHQNEEGKIFIEPQGFCVMAGIGHESGYGKKALESAESLLGDKYGLELLNPPYSTYHVELGEISSYPPGYKENGAVFNHNNPWVTIAHCIEKQPKAAYSLYIKNAPSFIEEYSDIHKTEPYVYSQMIAGRYAKNYGQAKNSWLTGSATWSFVALSQYLLGIKPDYDGLIIEPCLPKETFKKIHIVRQFRGTTYLIDIDNTIDNPTCYVNGKPIKGRLVPSIRSTTPVKVELH